MTLQEILASLVGPAGAPAMATAVGDHNNPATLQQAMMRFQQPQPAPQMAAHAFSAPQAPSPAPMPQGAPQAAPAAPVGGGILGGLGDAIGSLIAPQRAGRNQTIRYLTGQGLDEGTATLLASDKGALSRYLLQRTQGQGPTEFDQRAQAAAQYGLDPNSEEGRAFILSGHLPEARGGAAELGLNPQYGVDANGNPVLLQLGKDGKVVKSALPDGVTLSKQPIKMDAGTHWVLLDPITRQSIGTIPKDLAGAEAQKAIGEQQGKQFAAAPQDVIAAQNALDLIGTIRNDPYKARGTGLSSVLNSIPGTGGYDFANKVQGAKSGAFLTAIQQMRGLGSLSDAEGRAATSAINRMNTSTSEQEFDAALSDYEKIVRQGLQKAQLRLKGDFNSTLSQPAESATPEQPKAPPAVGEVRYGYRFKGGDPSEPSNWEKAR